MSNLKYKSEGGKKSGHSNMDHWVYTEEIKDATRKRRRTEEKEIVRHGTDDYESASLCQNEEESDNSA
jgi:hypothetical protein